MSENRFTKHIEGDTPADQTPSAPDVVKKNGPLSKAQIEFANFGKQYEKTINAYFGTPDIQFTCTDKGWYVNLEDMVVNADPTFFLEKGYGVSEALFATFHEAEHFRDMVKDQTAYTQFFDGVKALNKEKPGYGSAVSRLYNCVDDILVNKVVMSRWKYGVAAKDALYPKLFPSADLRFYPEPETGVKEVESSDGMSEGEKVELRRPIPRHMQFMYALLREAMLPNEPTQVDPQVREAIKRATDRPGARMDVIGLLTEVKRSGTGNMSPSMRFALMKSRVEPEFQKLYDEDCKDRKSEPPQKGKGKPGEPGQPGQPGEPGEPEELGTPGGEPQFEDPFEDAIPDPVDFDQVLDEIGKLKAAQAAAKKKQFEEVFGVTEEDMRQYRRDYEAVEKSIEELSKVFDAVISRRRIKTRALRKSVIEGVMLDPRKAATGVAEIKGGNFDPKVMLDYETKEKIRNSPSELEFTLVCDGSGSVDGNPDRKLAQRRLGVLILEALVAFDSRIQKMKRKGEDIRLSIKTELRLFADEDECIKPLSDSLTHQERVVLNKRLRKLPSGGNHEENTFHAIESEQFTPERLNKLEKGELKKVILFLTDGGTDLAKIQDGIKRMQVLAGPSGSENLVVAGLGFADGTETLQTYAPNGYYAATLEDLPAKFTEFLKKITDDL